MFDELEDSFETHCDDESDVACPDELTRLLKQLTLNRIEVRETDSSVVIYTREDWVEDNRYFANEMRQLKV